MPREGIVHHGEVRSDLETPQTWRELARARTACGDELVLRERAGIFEIRCNGWELMSSRAHHSEEWMARTACEQLRADAPSVLIGGLGMGFTLRAALEVLPAAARVVVAELLPEVIAWNRGVLASLARRPLEDPRLSVACADVGELLQRDSFDAIVLDVDNGPGAVMLQGNAPLYSLEGVQRLQRALRGQGVLAVWSASPSAPFETILREAGLRWGRTDVPARGTEDDPLHSIYVASTAVASDGASRGHGRICRS